MRLNSTDKILRTHTVIVTVDGKDITNTCFLADEEEGYVECCCMDSNGQWVVEGEEVKSERIYGKVEITLNENFK